MMKNMLTKICCGVAVFSASTAVVNAANQAANVEAAAYEVGIRPNCTSTIDCVKDAVRVWNESRGSEASVKEWVGMASRLYGRGIIFGVLCQAARLDSVWYNGLQLKTSPYWEKKTDEEILAARKKMFDDCNLQGCFDLAKELADKGQLEAACELFDKLQKQLGDESFKAKGFK